MIFPNIQNRKPKLLGLAAPIISPDVHANTAMWIYGQRTVANAGAVTRSAPIGGCASTASQAIESIAASIDGN